MQSTHTLSARLNVDVVQTTQDTSGKLGTERVPDTVLDLRNDTVLVGRSVNGDTLLTIDSLAGGQVLGDKQIFLSTTSNEDTGVTVRLDDNLSTTLGTSSTAAATSTATTATRSSTTTATATAATAITESTATA